MNRQRLFILFAALTIGGTAFADSVGVSQNETQEEVMKRLNEITQWENFKSQQTLLPPEGMGFMWPGASSIPHAVSECSKSVFEIGYVTGEPDDIYDPEVMIEEIKAQDLREPVKILILDQLNSASKNRRDRVQFKPKLSLVLDF